MNSQRLKFRKFGNTDFDIYILILGNEDVMKMITGRALSEKEALKRFETVLSINYDDNDIGCFAIHYLKSTAYIGLRKNYNERRKRS